MSAIKKALLVGGVPVRPSTKRERLARKQLAATRALARNQLVVIHEPTVLPEAAWFVDPLGQATYRWWDGTRWTAHTA
jgi:hypothetical protein